ncbi:MAG: type II secretion system protein [Candidatus Microsaccharimonas sp.]
MHRMGFTIVELIVTITIMGILLTLGVVGLDASQVNARDAERKADVEIIRLALESFYDTPNSSHLNTAGGSYPGRLDIANNFSSVFPAIDQKATHAPNVDIAIPAPASIVLTNSLAPQYPTTSQYIYQPITKSGIICDNANTTKDCRKYVLYYRLESDNTVYTITSRHQ